MKEKDTAKVSGMWQSCSTCLSNNKSQSKLECTQRKKLLDPSSTSAPLNLKRWFESDPLCQRVLATGRL
ncbi:hypothetical protein CMV_017876 [Castanea mollissima]|uniref:Uncharacterized protein n=1 Tax=Castanea mollissima TaxID=60419 RepID=A0A8J4VQ42_9ROSI|nr:hypothetical protein CMV_017876 [Castanea mollissima]